MLAGAAGGVSLGVREFRHKCYKKNMGGFLCMTGMVNGTMGPPVPNYGTNSGYGQNKGWTGGMGRYVQVWAGMGRIRAGRNICGGENVFRALLTKTTAFWGA